MTVILRSGRSHPAAYELIMFIDASDEVNVRLRTQARYQPSMPEDLMQLIKTDFNESCRKVFTSALSVMMTRLEMFTRTLASWNFLPERVVLPRVFQDQPQVTTEHLGKRVPTVHQYMVGGGSTITGRLSQETVANPAPIPEMQVRPGFKLRLAMDMAKTMTG